jgi:hypothetical protein
MSSLSGNVYTIKQINYLTETSPPVLTVRIPKPLFNILRDAPTV